MTVIDASSILEILLQTNVGIEIQEIVFQETNLVAPGLLDIEVCQVLRRHVLAKQISDKRGGEALDDFSLMPIVRYSPDIYRSLIWSLRKTVSAYDAAYLALAILLEAPLMTQDRRLARAADSHVPVIIF